MQRGPGRARRRQDPSGAALANGRAAGTITDDDTAPTIADVSPKGNKVSPNEDVTATCSVDMNPITLTTDAVRLLKQGKPVAASVSYDPASMTVTLDPNRGSRAE